jgi:hypothetical protein
VQPLQSAARPRLRDVEDPKQHERRGQADDRPRGGRHGQQHERQGGHLVVDDGAGILAATEQGGGTTADRHPDEAESGQHRGFGRRAGDR